MSTFLLTGSQTVGPFFSPALLREDARRNVLTKPETAGERIRIEGRVLDGDGVPVPDAMVEIWQANAYGRYNHPADSGPAPLDPSFLGFGRSGTEDDGRYWFETVKPGAVPFLVPTRLANEAAPLPLRGQASREESAPTRLTNEATPLPLRGQASREENGERWQAPHICVTVFSRGLLNHVVTRMYFEDEASNAGDPVLECVPADRRATLLARRVAGRESDSALAVYRFDIVLQGADETAFFNL